MTATTSFALAFLALTPPALAAADVSFFVGPPGGVGRVEIHDESGAGSPVTPPELANVRLLALDFVGRTRIGEFLPWKPRLRSDVAGAARLELQGGLGSLYRYERALPTGGAAFGFFVIGSDGAARPLWEHPGSGVAGDTDPLVGRIGVSATGAALLVATTLAAGGDLVEIDVVTGASVARTTTLAPLDFQSGGLQLLTTWGVGVAADGIYRFDRTDPAAQAQLVPVTGVAAPAWYQGDVVCSGNELVAATVAGQGPTLAHVLCFGPTGDAHAVDPVAAQLSGAGFLPEAVSGPHLALNFDGTLAAWRTEDVISREAWVGHTLPLPASPPVHLSGGAFLDTLDETGSVLFFAATGLVLAIGEKEPLTSEIEALDMFRVDIAADGTPSYTNLTLTSGDASAPFETKGKLDTEGGLFLTPLAQELIVLDRSSDTLAYTSLAQPGLQPLLSKVKSLELVEPVGSDLVLAVRRTTPGKERELIRVASPVAAPISVLASLPDPGQFLRPAVDAGGSLALVVEFNLSEWVIRLKPSTGALELLLPFPLAYGPSLAFTPNGSLAFTLGGFASPAFFTAWTPAGAGVLYPVATTPGQVLPGS